MTIENPDIPGTSGSMNVMSKEVISLFHALQKATQQLQIGRSRLGLIDLVTVGLESKGKSSLLAAMSNISLPTGAKTTTLCPIRLNLKSSKQEPVLKWPGGSDRPLGSGLDSRTYEEALRELQKLFPCPELGGITRAELVIEAGDEGLPPLSILDLPGLVGENKDAPHKQAIDELVTSHLKPGSDGSQIMPILVGSAGDTAKYSLRTDLVKGRQFLTVLTHAPILWPGDRIHDLGKIRAFLEWKAALKKEGCEGVFLVSVPDGKDAPGSWYKGLCNAPDLSAAEQEELLGMCGVPNLLKRLHELQFGHMMHHHSPLMAKLRQRLQALQPAFDRLSTPERDLRDSFCDELSKIQNDVRESFDGKTRLAGGPSDQIPPDFQLHVMVDHILKSFSLRSLERVLDVIQCKIQEMSCDVLADSTLMTDWKKEGWNLITYADLVLQDDFAGKARLQLKDMVKTFVLMRFETRAFKSGWESAISGFTIFLDQYLDDKLDLLVHEANVMYEEMLTNKLATFAPFAYWFFYNHRDQANELAVDVLAQSLRTQSSKAGDVAQDFSAIHLPWFRETITDQWKDQQVKVMVFVFLRVSELIERLCNRMISVLINRTATKHDHLLVPTDKTLASHELEKAFKEYCRRLGDGMKMESWLEGGKGKIKEDHRVLSEAVEKLQVFSDQARLARPLDDDTTRTANRFAQKTRMHAPSPDAGQPVKGAGPSQPGFSAPGNAQPTQPGYGSDAYAANGSAAYGHGNVNGHGLPSGSFPTPGGQNGYATANPAPYGAIPQGPYTDGWNA